MNDQHNGRPWWTRDYCPDCGGPKSLYAVHCWECTHPGLPRPIRSQEQATRTRVIQALRRHAPHPRTEESALVWAASQPDNVLRGMRNVGPKGLLVLRAMAPYAAEDEALRQLLDAGLVALA